MSERVIKECVKERVTEGVVKACKVGAKARSRGSVQPEGLTRVNPEGVSEGVKERVMEYMSE